MQNYCFHRFSGRRLLHIHHLLISVTSQLFRLFWIGKRFNPTAPHRLSVTNSPHLTTGWSTCVFIYFGSIHSWNDKKNMLLQCWACLPSSRRTQRRKGAGAEKETERPIKRVPYESTKGYRMWRQLFIHNKTVWYSIQQLLLFLSCQPIRPHSDTRLSCGGMWSMPRPYVDVYKYICGNGRT
jgi:hypothetical protein